jgi:hypothetical protein
MNVKSQQVEQPQQTSHEPEDSRNRAARKHTGRAAMAIVTIAIGVALTALVLGVTGGTDTDTDAPPSPGVSRPYGNELPPQGLDKRLQELAPEKPAVPPKGIDQRLYEMAEE